jgi:hypothetical protein
VSGLWVRLARWLRHLTQRVSDRWWALTEPAGNRLLAGRRRFMIWRRSFGDGLWVAWDATREKWRRATHRRRATVAALAVLPIAMVAAVTAMLLPAGGDPQALPAQVRMGADAPPEQKDLKPVSSTTDARPDSGREPAGKAAARQDGSTSDAPAAAVAGVQASAGDGGDQDGGGDYGGGQSGAGLGLGGDDSPASDDTGSPGGERQTSAPPAPSPRSSPRREPAGDDDQRPAPRPAPPAPAPKSTAPQADVPAPPPPPPPPPPAPPLVTEQTSPVTEPDTGSDQNSDTSESDGPGNGQGNGPPPGRGHGHGGDDDDEHP